MNDGPSPSPDSGPLGVAPPALVAGTRLRTPDGPVAVEALAPGDRLLAADGAQHLVHWIGQRTLRLDLMTAEERARFQPVVIAAGTLGPDLPERRLQVSPGLVMHLTAPPPATAAAAPTWEGDTVRYLHVETAAPALLLAEGVAVESFRAHSQRNAFANVETWEPIPLPAVPAPEPEPPVVCDADGLTGDPGLHLVAGGRVLRPSAIEDDLHRFTIPGHTVELRIASRSVIPAEIDPAQGDRRRLGVALRHLRLLTPTLEIEIGPDEEALTEGFHTAEPGLRWTDGSALVPPRFYRWIAEPAEIEIRILTTALRYPVAAAPPAPLASAEPAPAPPARRRRALVIDACTPTPDRDAGSNVTLWHMRLLQDLGYDVTFVPQDNFTAIPGYTPALHALGIETIEIPAFSRMEPFLAARGATFDLAYVHRYEVAEACIALLRAHAPQAPILFNNADLHYLRLDRAAALSGDPDHAARAAEAMRRELAVIAASDVTVLCSSAERDLIAAELPNARLHVLPWVIEPRADAAPPHAARRDIMFLGGFGHPPNVDAMQWFVAEVMPILRRLRPKIRLHIYGAAMPPEIEALASDAVVIGGHVPDLRPVFDRHLAAVAPLRYGAGFKGKVAEALAAGIPNVATPIAVEGTGLVAGTHVLVAETAPSFAMAIARLDADAGLWDRLAAAGLAFVHETLSPVQGRQHLADILALIGQPSIGQSASGRGAGEA